MTTATPARQAFESTAPFYDELTDYSDYERALDVIESLARDHGLVGRRLLDVGCGTGKSFMPMLGRGYEVTACDLSPAMVDLAEAKAKGTARVFVADMRELGRVGSFDLITCIDEPLNYLLDEAGVSAFFRSAALNLAPDGVLVFDVNTIATYASAFAGRECYEVGDWLFVWRGEADPGFTAGQTAAVTIDAFGREADGRWRRESSRHVQRHYGRRTLRRLMREAGLECAGLYGLTHEGDVSRSAREDCHSKFAYVARLARATGMHGRG